jgi:hypothetical protein
MEVVFFLNEAVVDCQAGVPDAAYAVDKAVAYYTGSRTTEANSSGLLLFASAEKRAVQMNTITDISAAFVNVEIFLQLNSMKIYLIANETVLCNQVEQSKDHIVTMMKVPIVQSIIHSAYIQSNEPPSNKTDEEKVISEGATFAAAMLPFIHDCDPKAADTLHRNMKLGVIANFDEVKTAMETTYNCLNITCEHIGGIWNGSNYVIPPCATTSGSVTAAISYAFVIFITAVGIILTVA